MSIFEKQLSFGRAVIETDEANAEAVEAIFTCFDRQSEVSSVFPDMRTVFSRPYDWIVLRLRDGKWQGVEPDFTKDPYSEAGTTTFLRLLPLFYNVECVLQAIGAFESEMPDWNKSVTLQKGITNQPHLYLHRPTENRIYNDSGWFITYSPITPDPDKFNYKACEGSRVCDLLKIRPALIHPMALPTAKYTVEMMGDRIVSIRTRDGMNVWPEGCVEGL